MVRPSFLKTEVTSASFISGGNLPNSNDLLNSWCKIGLKMSILSLSIFIGMPEFGEDLEESSFLNCFSIPVYVMLLKQKVLQCYMQQRYTYFNIVNTSYLLRVANLFKNKFHNFLDLKAGFQNYQRRHSYVAF